MKDGKPVALVSPSPCDVLGSRAEWRVVVQRQLQRDSSSPASWWWPGGLPKSDSSVVAQHNARSGVAWWCGTRVLG